MPPSKKSSTKASSGRTGLVSRMAEWSDRFGKIVSLVLALTTLFSTFMWWRLDSRLKEAGLTEAELKLAQIEPTFSVQYMVFGGAVFADVKRGHRPEGDGSVRPSKDARTAYENLWQFPLIDTRLGDRLASDRLDAFLRRYLPGVKPREEGALDAVKYTVLVLSAFGGTRAVDAELVYEERILPGQPFLFPPEGFRYVDAPMEYLPGAPVQSETLAYRKAEKVLKLGDIEPGSGRIVPIQAGLVAEEVPFTDGGSANVDVIGSFHLKPIKIRYKTISGESREQPIREQLDVPMPLSDYIDIRG